MKRLTIVSLFFLILAACDKSAEPHLNSKSSSSTVVNQKKITIEDNAPSRVISLEQPSARKWWHDAVFYQIWPRSFYDANGDGNGDFIGLEEKIPYLKALGVSAIWLTPILESPSYHGYDAVDFYSVEKDYGTEAEFESFLKKTEVEGIKVIIDLVVNHVSDQHPWFKKSVNREPSFDDYFIWSKTLPANYGSAWSDTPNPTKVWHYNDVRKEYYYGVFGYSQPDLNLKNAKVLAEVKKIAAHWMDKGVDGFRLDAVRYFIEEGGIPLQADTKSNYEFLEGFSSYIKNKNPNVYLVGEAFADSNIVATYFRGGKGIDGAFDFDFSMNVHRALETKQLQEKALDVQEKLKAINLLKEAFWNNLVSRNSKNAPGYFFVPFINNHDIDRFATNAETSSVRASVAAGLLLTSPGSPYIYYGDEIGMSQFDLYDDVYRRSLMQWDSSNNAGFNSTGTRWLDQSSWFPWKKSFEPWWERYWGKINNKNDVTVERQSAQKNSLLAHYKKLIALRENDLILRSPETIHFYEDTANVWVVRYTRDNQFRWIVLNLDADSPSTFKAPPLLQGAYVNLLNDELLTNGPEISIAAGELLVLSTE